MEEHIIKIPDEYDWGRNKDNETTKTMKTTIRIKQYDNGISIEDEDDEGNVTAIVSLERTMAEDIGRLIWQHVKNMMDAKPSNKVKMEIEFI